MPGRTPPTAAAQARAHARAIVRGLGRLYPEVRCALEHRDPFQLIVATILSAQCTDARVNQVTPALFARYPDAPALAGAEPAELERLIHSTGFFRAKAKNLIGMARALVAGNGGKVPADLDALTALPGVGRKTAHVVLGVGSGIPSGVVVDTHVKRLAYRLGLTDSGDPEVIEHELAAAVPRREWIDLSHRLIQHGRSICTALRPRCADCALSSICPRRGVSGGSG